MNSPGGNGLTQRCRFTSYATWRSFCERESGNWVRLNKYLGEIHHACTAFMFWCECSGCQINVLASIEGNHSKMAENVVTFKIGEAYKTDHPKLHSCNFQSIP